MKFDSIAFAQDGHWNAVASDLLPEDMGHELRFPDVLLDSIECNDDIVLSKSGFFWRQRDARAGLHARYEVPGFLS